MPSLWSLQYYSYARSTAIVDFHNREFRPSFPLNLSQIVTTGTAVSK